MPPNVAIALFVKDEFSDIAGWIAWHAALGVQTFFIYDDYSTDGTWEILQAAAKCYDIRLRRIDPLTLPHFADRQRDAYMQTAQEAKSEFDWLGFLDGDEYLYLKHFDNLPDFLMHFPHADAIGFSWRIYGSSERVIRPHKPVVEAFTKHSSKDFVDNQHIKSFVRPQKMGDKYFDPHYFDIPPERYARPSGKRINQPNAFQEVEWSDGFVMHFICRSMEHYIERIKRRRQEDLSDTTAYWHYFNRNEENDFEPLRLIPQMECKLFPIVQECLKLAIRQLKDLPITPDPAFYPEKPSAQSSKIFQIHTHCQTQLYYTPVLKEAVHCSEKIAKEKNFSPIWGVLDSQTEKVMALFIAGDESGSLFKILYDHRRAGKLFYRIICQKSGETALFNPGSKQFLSFLPVNDAGIGKIEANRDKAHEWENVTFKSLLNKKAPFSVKKLPFTPTEKTSAYAVLNWIKTSPELPDGEDFLRVLYSLSPKVQQEISGYAPGLLREFI